MKRRKLVVWMMAGVVAAGMARGEALWAVDRADDPAYGDGWQTGDTGGSGWGSAWNLTTSAFPPDGNVTGHFIGSSQGNGSGDGNIDTSGVSLGLYANSGFGSYAYRDFNGTLGIGQSVIVDMDNGFIDNGGIVGFRLTEYGEPGTTDQFSFFFSGGGSTYHTSVGSFMWYTETDTGVDFTTAGLRVMFTVVDADSYALAITPNGGSTTYLSGDFIIPVDLDHIELYNINAGSGSENDAFFNNIQIVPEPASASLLLLGLSALLRRRR